MRYDGDQDHHDAETVAQDRHGRGLPVRERDYLVPAKDARGGSIRVQCRTQPELGRIIAEVHAAKRYPFRLQGDLIRWCLDAGVKLLAAGAGIPSVTAQAEVIRQMLIDEEYQLSFAENFGIMKRVIDKYLALGAPQKARESLTRTKQHIEAMPSDYWRQQYLTEIERQYGGLLDGVTHGSGSAALLRLAASGGSALLAHDDGDE